MTTPVKLINNKPSPFGRKVIIALEEKNVPYVIELDIPWHSDTTVPEYNPLEQLPILITDSGETVYESSYILEWLEVRYPEPPLVPAAAEDRLKMNLFRVLSVGVMDAIVRINFELARPSACQSEAWKQRQKRKTVGGIREIGRLLDGREFAVAGMLTHADLEIGAVLGHLDFLIENIPPLGEVLEKDVDWRSLHSGLDAYIQGLEQRPSFLAAPREMVEIDFQSVIA